MKSKSGIYLALAGRITQILADIDRIAQYPATKVISKQLLPIYDKPMI